MESISTLVDRCLKCEYVFDRDIYSFTSIVRPKPKRKRSARTKAKVSVQETTQEATQETTQETSPKRRRKQSTSPRLAKLKLGQARCRKCTLPFKIEDLGEGLCQECWDRLQ